MKVLILTIALLCFASNAMAIECDNIVELDWTKWETLKETWSMSFPLNMLQYGYDLLDNLSNVSPTSPSEVQIGMFGIYITPLAFMDSGAFDWLFQGMRIVVLGIILLSIVKHVLEVIL